ncbi:protein phosphatase 2C domain-containing protein [Streptomyces solicathayae]|uniref:Protein phosphatase 2C domain-containing protein n=1 Tax=Streptomyces solicathayae TaxID=3081768 RepID=A0ABZ0LV22_9ACTN|nr:protein phosphatase 2C domain-containing protein [Streptomyces sp. HUAS YS2]WOX23350.1 protein phosphatase 2C domain-containing protein [Streptomyces sp. HUAS YS2]
MHVALSSAARPGGSNEDFAVGSAECVVVLDGAGTPEGLPTGCIHGVAWFARTLGSALHSEAVEARGNLAGCLATAIRNTTDLHRGTCDVDSPFSPSATVAVLRSRGAEAEWLVLGDAALVLDHGGEPEVITDQRLAGVASEERAALRTAVPGSVEEGRTHTRLVQAERAMRNTPGGYWVAAADPGAAEEAITGSTPLAHVRRAALLTDGAARFVDTFALGDWSACLDTLQQHGPADLIKQVRDAEFSDPALDRWPRSKMHDDATVIFARP